MSELPLLTAVAVAITLLLFFVIHLKLHAFVALFLVSLFVGIATGMPLHEVIGSMQKGMGETLGFVAVLVGLGAMFGQMLEVSGGAERLARTLVKKFGQDKIPWALGFTGFFVGIPVFFDVGFIILIPIVYRLAKKNGRSLLYYGIPLFAGLSVAHSFIPPTPGPVAVAHLIGADLGWVILFGIIAGIPAMMVGGPLFGKYIAGKIMVTVPAYMETEEKEDQENLPGFGLLAVIILIPLFLIMLYTASSVLLEEENPLRTLFSFLGHPFVALLISTLLVFYFLGIKRGYSKQDIRTISGKALEPAGMIMLITGAGGVFKQVLVDSEVGSVLGQMMADSALPPVIVSFLIASSVRILQGSATVAMVTSASLMVPLIEALALEGPILGLIVISIAAGSTIASHVNDSGFWLVNRYLGLNVKDTLFSWTIMETVTSLTGFLAVVILSLFIT